MINQELDEVVENLEFCQAKSYPGGQIDDENDEMEREDFEFRTKAP